MYSLIYADPPWHYRNASVRGAAKHHYPILTDRDIVTLPVATIAMQDAALFLWVPYPKLAVGLQTVSAWGFTYKTVAFTWVKLNKVKSTLFMGPGFYTRANCEVCLLGMRGSLKRKSRSVHSVIMAHRMNHSAKPSEVRDRIVELFGNRPRIELFAGTHELDGWHTTGLHADGLDIRTYFAKKIT